MKTRFGALALLLAAAVTSAHADPLITFDLTASGASGPLAVTTYSGSAFAGNGIRVNETVSYHDIVETYGNYQYTWHYSAVSWQEQGSYYDYFAANVSGATAGQSVLLTGSASVDAGHASGPVTFDGFSSITGTYTPVTNPAFPGLVIPPGAPAFASGLSADPAQWATQPAFANFAPNLAFSASANVSYTIDADGTSDLGFLLYAPDGLHADYFSLYLNGQLYDAGLYSFAESNYLGFDVVAVPEPSTWAMLLAGAGVLGFARRRRTAALAA